MTLKAKTWAQALWETLQQKPLKEVSHALTLLRSFWDWYSVEPRFRDFFGHPEISLKDKQEVLAKFIGHEKAPEEIGNFLSLLLVRGEMDELLRILEVLEALKNAYFQTMALSVETAQPLSKTEKEELEKQLKETFKSTHLELHESADPDLLGGLVLRFNGQLFDASLKNKLAKTKRALV